MTSVDIVTRVAPLGLRFWDSARSDVVRDGLIVRAWPAARPTQLRTARVNRSGIWSFASLPGMTSFESGLGDAAYWAKVQAGNDPQLGARRAFVVEVLDAADRFLPVRLQLDLPIRGLSAWPPPGATTATSDPDAPRDALPLFSAPQRTVAGLAVVRLELLDIASGLAARDALVEVLQDAVVVGRGLSDARGRALVIFSYPEPAEAVVGIPDGSPAQVIANTWSWEVTLRVRWRASAEPSVVPPVLSSLLDNPLVTVLDLRSPEVPLGPQTLHFGEPLIVHTRDFAERRLCIRS